MRFIDLAGQRFGRLSVIGRAPNRNKNPAFFCLCDCGTQTTALGGNLRKGSTQSCGCLMVDRTIAANRVHGAASRRDGRSREYQSWAKMIQRCTNPNDPNFEKYGGRGISVCERWMAFENFILDMGVAPEGLTIDRKDNNGNYEPANCHWVDRRAQANNRRSNRLISHNGVTQTLSQWARERGIKVSTLGMRLNQYKWPVAKALGE